MTKTKNGIKNKVTQNISKIKGVQVFAVNDGTEIDQHAWEYVETVGLYDKLTEKQMLFLYYYTTCGLNGTMAAKKAGIPVAQVQQWKKSHPAFAKNYDELQMGLVLAAENVLMRKLEEGDANVAMFVLKQLDKAKWGNGTLNPADVFQKHVNITVNIPKGLSDFALPSIDVDVQEDNDNE